jgi:hypothetical protein
MSFSMISAQGAGAFGDTGSAANILGFANRWQDAAEDARQRAMQLQRDMINSNSLQATYNDQGMNNLLGDMKMANQAYALGNTQMQQRSLMMLQQCATSSLDPQQRAQCQAQLDAMTGRTPAQTQTGQTPNMSVAPNMPPTSINDILGVGR